MKTRTTPELFAPSMATRPTSLIRKLKSSTQSTILQIVKALVSRYQDFQDSRCFYSVSVDGAKLDFSYRKYVENFLKEKYPDKAKAFIPKYYRRQQALTGWNKDRGSASGESSTPGWKRDRTLAPDEVGTPHWGLDHTPAPDETETLIADKSGTLGWKIGRRDEAGTPGWNTERTPAADEYETQGWNNEVGASGWNKMLIYLYHWNLYSFSSLCCLII